MTHLNHGMSKFDKFMKDCLEGHALAAPPLPDTFGRLMPANPVTGNLGNQHIVDAFDHLVDGMRTDDIADGPADAGMTFLAQFVDHDITLDATSAIGQKIDPRSIRNIRTPNLDLDCIYGDGPEASPYLYSPDHEHFLLMGTAANPRDVPRNSRGTALIGDPRNDENVIISQLQGAFITLHNILMTRAEAGGDTAHDVSDCAAMGVRQAVWDHVVPEKQKGFEEVRRFIRMHYQWIILNEMLPAFAVKADLEKALHHDPFHELGVIMPVEFAGAAYRFGHATVQPRYKLTAAGDPVDLFATVGFGPRPADSDLEMAQFFGPHAQKALPVGDQMAGTLFNLPFVDEGIEFENASVSVAQAAKLGLRNILRDRFALLLPSGQQVARKLGIPALHAPAALKDKHIDKTPLWFYCLQEARENGGGCLTGVGAAILGSVFGRLLRHDPESVWHLPDFKPWSGFDNGSGSVMAGMMDFVEQHRDEVAHAEDLTSG